MGATRPKVYVKVRTRVRTRMRRSAMPRHVPPPDSKTSFSAKCHKNLGFAPAFPLICAELPMPYLLGCNRPQALLARHGWRLPNQRRHFAGAAFRAVSAALAVRFEHDAEKACPGRDPGRIPVFRKRSCRSKRENVWTVSSPAPGNSSRCRCRRAAQARPAFSRTPGVRRSARARG